MNVANTNCRNSRYAIICTIAAYGTTSFRILWLLANTFFPSSAIAPRARFKTWVSLLYNIVPFLRLSKRDPQPRPYAVHQSRSIRDPENQR